MASVLRSLAVLFPSFFLERAILLVAPRVIFCSSVLITVADRVTCHVCSDFFH